MAAATARRLEERRTVVRRLNVLARWKAWRPRQRLAASPVDDRAVVDLLVEERRPVHAWNVPRRDVVCHSVLADSAHLTRSERHPSDRSGCDTLPVLTAFRDELGRLASYEERHRRLLCRLALIVIATGLVDALGSVAMYVLEHGTRGTEIKTFGQAVFFTTVQLLTVSSQIKNPVTAAGRIVDVALELWAVVVVAGSAGAVATFFQSADARSSDPRS